MKQYLDLVRRVIERGTYKPNRTGVDSVASFSEHYAVDLSRGFPLLTTKRMDGFRWESLVHELLWYLSGREHIRELRERTGIWDAWADDEGHLDTAYGRFWRRFPVPGEDGRLPGEAWPDDAGRWVDPEEGTFDQLRYVLDTLREDPHSRRMVVSAWHPANAAVSQLPPCHYTFVLNVQGDRLNLHLTQRSGDVALGVPFNIAAYALLATAIAGRTGYELGAFGHTVVDAHVYCGRGERGAWYDEHLPALRDRLVEVDDRTGYRAVRDWLEDAAPPEDEAGYDHVPGLLEQLAREPLARPRVEIADKPLDELTFEDVRLREYRCADGLEFKVAE